MIPTLMQILFCAYSHSSQQSDSPRENAFLLRSTVRFRSMHETACIASLLLTPSRLLMSIGHILEVFCALVSSEKCIISPTLPQRLVNVYQRSTGSLISKEVLKTQRYSHKEVSHLAIQLSSCFYPRPVSLLLCKWGAAPQ